ncbi:YadA-like family protein, partial [Megasphaera sp.]|uniref:YadA-like family protein n=1 Tax=Megasphaera sp. TaxID=2023260 RepID=UPI003F09469F
SIKAGGVTIDSTGIDAGGKNITNVKSGIVNGDDTDNANAANIGDVKKLAGEAAKGAVDSLGTRDFTGDDGEKISKKLGESMKLSGGADTTKLTDGNIGVVKNADGTGLDIKLSSELKGLTSVTTGNSTLNNDGLTINNSEGKAGTTITNSGIKIAANGDNTHDVEIGNSNVSMGGQQIHDVAAGTSTTDAVNVGQLSMFANNVGSAINKLDNRVNRVGAGAAALAALHPLDFDPDDKWDFAGGFGHYKNANAAAIGAYYRPNEDTMFSIGGSFGGGENMVNAGVSFKLGQGNHVSTSRTMMAKEIESLKAVVKEQNEKLQENENLRAKVDKQDKEIAELKAMVQQLAARR